jgi:hypothetical protein
LKSWLDHEARFRSLAPSLQFVRLDRQWGSSGEHWHLAGSASVVTREFEALCALAGRSLVRVLRQSEPSDAELLNEQNDKIRWYRALIQLSGQFKSELPASELDANGKVLGHIYYGSLHDLGQNSANVCLSLQASRPLPEKSRRQKFWDEYGSKILIGIILALVAAVIRLLLG